MPRLIRTPQANEDLLDIWEYLAVRQQQPDMGDIAASSVQVSYVGSCYEIVTIVATSRVYNTCRRLCSSQIKMEKHYE